LSEISDKITKLVETILRSSTWTSAGDTRVQNFLAEFRGAESFDIDNDVKNVVDKKSDTGKKFKKADKGHMGEINRMTSTQFGNIRELAQNPAGFIIQTFVKKFAKGVGIVALALIIFEAVKWIIGELLKPGRFLDLRFKRDINKEIIAFRRREDQQKIKQGFSSIIITSIPRLRGAGAVGQVTNTLNMASGRQPFPDNFGSDPLGNLIAGVSFSKASGRRSGLGPGR